MTRRKREDRFDITGESGANPPRPHFEPWAHREPARCACPTPPAPRDDPAPPLEPDTGSFCADALEAYPAQCEDIGECKRSKEMRGQA